MIRRDFLTGTSRLAAVVLGSAIFVPAMLFADGPNPWLQVAVGAATGLFVFLLVRGGSVPGVQVVAAMTIATTGELVLSLGWGLYGYRFAAVPYFVPPGHGLFYLLAAETAAHPWVAARGRGFRVGVATFGTLWAVLMLGFSSDSWGLLWWIGALAMIRFSDSGLLVACAYLYTMPLEWLGTWNRNWWWYPDVPGLPFVSGNPPSGVAVLYGLLDLLAVLACGSPFVRRLIKRSRPVEPQEEPALELEETAA